MPADEAPDPDAIPDGRGFTRRQAVQRGAALGALLVAGRVSGCGGDGPAKRNRRSGASAVNLITNPRAARGLDGWAATARLQRVDDGIGPGGTAVELRLSGRGAILPAGRDPVRVTAGSVAWCRVSVRATGAPPDAVVYLAIAYRGALGSPVHPIATVAAAGAAEWVTLYGFDTVPAGATSSHLVVGLRTSGPSPYVLRVTRAMLAVDPSEVLEYVDGDSPGGRWLGRPHASASEAPLPGRVLPARPGFRFGFNDNASQTSGLRAATDVALHREVGSALLRVSVNLASTQFGTAPGQQIDWAQPYPGSYDAVYAACLDAGVAMLPIALFCPPWMGVEQGFPPPRRHFAAWADLCGQLARRWPKAAGIEVWNEPNLGNYFWQPRPDPAAYVELLARSHREVKRAAPGLPVLLGGVNGIPASDAHSLSVTEFLAGVYAAGAKGRFDGVSLHSYLGELAGTGSYFDASLQAARTELARHGDRVPLWVTETGVSSGSSGAASGPRVDERRQALIDRLLVGILKRQPDVSAACIHTLVAPSSLPSSDYESGFEVIEHATGRRKPAFAALRAEALGRRAR